MRHRLAVVILLVLVGTALGCAAQTTPAAPEIPAPRPLAHRWLFVFRSHNQPGAVEKTLALLPRAKAAGYNAIVLSDGGLNHLDLMSQAYRDNILRIQAETYKLGMEFIPIVYAMAWSNSLLMYDKNLAEGLPVKGARYVVGKGALALAPETPVSLPNGGFEDVTNDAPAGWTVPNTPAQTAQLDDQVHHSGARALRVRSGQGSVTQTVAVRPFHLYHLSLWVKTQDLTRPRIRIGVRAAEGTVPRRTLNYYTPAFAKTQDWTRYDFTFNSLEAERVDISLRSGGEGAAWFDDVALEETGLVNVLRRPGTPVTLKGEDGAVYEEGKDFEAIRDPLLEPEDSYHTPPTVKLTASSRLKEGTPVRLSYYHSVVINEGQVCACLSEPKLYQLLRSEAKQVNDLFHPTAFFMQHDEIRTANWDEACQKRHLTPGQMLADNVKQCVQMLKDLNPKAKIWVWSDMFDPMHNAGPKDAYYFVNGDWQGGWEGLPAEVGIVNWAGHLQGRNAKWFADRGHEQILSGYYDHDDTGRGFAGWLANTRDVPRVTGAMYTSWLDKYDAIEAWANAAWGGAGKTAQK